jgi:hypothetical protein
MATMTPKSTYTAKGSIAAATAASTPANLAVGNNGETLVADSSTSTGLRYQGNYAAGKNAIINGDFGVWQRGTSFSATNLYQYTADRWFANCFGGTTGTVTRTAFTAGTAPVTGYEGTYYANWTVAATPSTNSYFLTRLEDVRLFAGQTVTFSFWAKAASAKTLTLYIDQNYGSGGSGTTSLQFGTQAITTSWVRYTFTGVLPSISGKTIGTSSYIAPTIQLATAQGSFDISIWGFQLEAGSVATAFQTATGTIQGELAVCQRYYFRNTGGGATAYNPYANGGTISTTGAYISFPFPQQMRVAPTAIEFSGIAVQTSGGTLAALSTLTMDQVSGFNASLAAVTASTWLPNQPCRMINNNNVNGYVGFTAEL